MFIVKPPECILKFLPKKNKQSAWKKVLDVIIEMSARHMKK